MAQGHVWDMGTWRGQMVPTSASGSAETTMGTCHPKTSHLLVAHCAHHSHGHSHMGNASVPEVWNDVSFPSLHPLELSPILSKGWGCQHGPGTPQR